MARTTRKIVKVPLYGQPAGKVAKLEDGATVGATIGTDLRLPDGSTPTLAELAVALGALAQAPPTESLSLARTLWALIQGIPQNIIELAALSGEGLAFRAGDGNWSLVPREPVYHIQSEASKFWPLSDFVRGHNIIGVRNGGAAIVYLPEALPIERIVTVKNEANSGSVTVAFY